MANTVAINELEGIIKGAEGVEYGEILNDISTLRKSEASAKDYSRTLKFNYVECKSKLIFLEALKHELNVEALEVEFPSEDELKFHKSKARDIQAQNQELEAKILKQIEQINEYKKMLNKVTPQECQDENSSPNVVQEAPVDKYASMLSWYENVIKSIQVLSGISIQEYLQTEESLILVVQLKFSKHSHPNTSTSNQKHSLRILFDPETEKLTGAEVRTLSLNPVLNSPLYS